MFFLLENVLFLKSCDRLILEDNALLFVFHFLILHCCVFNTIQYYKRENVEVKKPAAK